MKLLIRIVLNAFALWVVTLIPQLNVSVIPFAPGETGQRVLTLLAIAAIFAIVNTILGTVLKVVTFPLYILTLGLFSFIVNGAVLWVTAQLTSGWSWGLRIEEFWYGVLAAVVMSLVNWVGGIILRPQLKR